MVSFNLPVILLVCSFYEAFCFQRNSGNCALIIYSFFNAANSFVVILHRCSNGLAPCMISAESADAIQFVNDYALNWKEFVAQGLADAAVTTKACADFGQPGWAPLCFLNGNPVFNAFDSFQASIQSLVILLHDFLTVCKYSNNFYCEL